MPRGTFTNPEERAKKISQSMLGNQRFLGKSHSEETKNRISQANKGREVSPEQRIKISQTLKNKGCRPPSSLGKRHTDETKRKMSESHKGKNTWSKGRKWTDEQRRNLSKIRKRGSENPNWRGGKERHGRDGKDEYNSLEYHIWRDNVFKRDNYTCQHCKTRGCLLNAHHIQPWALFLELRYTVENGLSLCTKCHFAEHKRIKLENNI